MSIPFGMLFKMYYCSNCGVKLEKEKTHRVVTKDDRDYYQYHEYGMFPLCDHDVYGYRFRCPSCKKRTSFDEQCVIERIQKQNRSIVLSSDEIKNNYEASREANTKRILLRIILIPIVFNFIFFTILYFACTNRTAIDLAKVVVLYTAVTAYSVFMVQRIHKGKGKRKINRSYAYEQESTLKKLHTYASHNKKLIEKSEKCYCFHCKNAFESTRIERYLVNEETALCPECGMDSIIPDSIDESIDENTILEMHDYWF